MSEELDYQQKVERCDAILEREKRRWALRRLMVKIAFSTLIALVLFLVMVAPYTMDGDISNIDLIKFILGCLTSIVLWYFGLSSIDDAKSKAMNVVKELLR